MLRSRPTRCVALALAAGAAALAVPTAASADTVARTLWHNKACGEDQSTSFWISPRIGHQRVRLSVHHEHQAAGTLEIRHEGRVFWTYDLPEHPHTGFYSVESPPLPNGSYTADFTRGRPDGYCRTTVEVMKPF